MSLRDWLVGVRDWPSETDRVSVSETGRVSVGDWPCDSVRRLAV